MFRKQQPTHTPRTGPPRQTCCDGRGCRRCAAPPELDDPGDRSGPVHFDPRLDRAGRIYASRRRS